MMKALSVATYAALRKKVEETLLLGQRKIEAAKVQTYWDTGHFINQHIQVNGARAEYGQKIVRRLAEDIDLHPSVLQRCSQFAEIFPDFKIVATWRQLAWAHFRILMTIPVKKIREEFARRANREHWNVAKLQQTVLFKVRNLLCDESGKALEGKPPSLLPVPVLGPFYTYQVIAPQTVHSVSKQLLLDLGFSCRLEMELFPGVHFPAGTILESKRRDKDEKGSPKHAPIARGYSIFKLVKSESPTTEASAGKRGTSPEFLLYNYKAFVQRFIDADTFHVELRLGFGQLREETIRLRGIDCPEINTPEGKAAKRFVERELGPCEFITIKSTQTRKEKWGRYLGDVFYTDKTGNQVYLNNLLLEKGYAVRVRD